MNPPVPRRQIWSNAQGCRKSSSTTFHTKCAPHASLRKTRRVDVNIWSSKLLNIGERRENTKTIQDFTSRVWCSVCERTPPANPAFPMLDLCCWLAHGSALIGCTHEQLLAETVEERTARERATETHPPAPSLDASRGMRPQVRDPLRFVDLTSKSRPHGTAPPQSAPSQQEYAPTEAEQRAAAHAARPQSQPQRSVPDETMLIFRPNILLLAAR